jgi:ABC-type multidrug transport system permease subunit
MITARIIRIISGIAGLGALLLGVLFWIAGVELISFHMLFGLIVALTLLVMSVIAVSTRGSRIWGLIGIVYAFIVLIFGVTQSRILVGDLHWLIRTLHLLVGLGALVLIGRIAARYAALKRPIAGPTTESQAVH